MTANEATSCPMKVLSTSVPIFARNMEAAIERYEALTRETARERFEVPEQGIEIAILGGLTIIAGQNTILARSETSARRSSSIRSPSTPHICARRAQRRFKGQIRRQPAQT